MNRFVKCPSILPLSLSLTPRFYLFLFRFIFNIHPYDIKTCGGRRLTQNRIIHHFRSLLLLFFVVHAKPAWKKLTGSFDIKKLRYIYTAQKTSSRGVLSNANFFYVDEYNK